MQSVTFNRVETGEQERATVGHQFRGSKVLAISGDDPVVVILERGEVFPVPSGSVVHTEAEAEPRAVRTERVAKPDPVASPVHPGEVKGVSYHSGAYGERTIRVGDLVGSKRITGIVRGDPVMVSAVDAKGLITSVSLCGAGSISKWIF
jgi:hypothetical protein